MSRELKIKGGLSADYQQIYIGDEATGLFIDSGGHIKSADIKSETDKLTLSSAQIFMQDGSGNSFTPSHNDHIANKKYVDDNAGGTSYHYTHHQWYATATTNVYIPFAASVTETAMTADSFIDDQVWIALFAGKIVEAKLYSDRDTGSTDLKLSVNGTLGSSLLSGGAVNCSSDKTVYTFTCDQNNTYSSGDVLRVFIENTNAPYQATMSIKWEIS